VNVGAETLLALAIGALYLKDCIFLLQVNEAVLVSRGRGRWAAGFGARTWRIAGREPFVANPWLPDRAVFRLRWRMTPAGAEPAGAKPARTPLRMPAELARIGRLAWLTWFALLVCLPVCLLGRLGPAVTIAAIAWAYASIIGSLALAWIWRRPLAISSRAFTVLAFECIACPPYAANIVRKLAALQRVDEDFEAAAARVLDSRHLAEARSECLARLDDQIERTGDGDPDFESLRQARGRFLPGE
jgi:hypothetical protein